MRCPECGTELGHATATAPVRCLDCGILVSAGRPGGDGRPQPGAKHSYQTPYGTFAARVEQSGAWAAVSQVRRPDGGTERLTRLVTNLSGPLQKIARPDMAHFRSFDAEHARILWSLPQGRSLVPLSALRTPLSPPVVRRLVELLAVPLRRLHRAGLGAVDLAPQLIFVERGLDGVVLTPTPWLASLARWNPGGIETVPFAAPELGGFGDSS